MPTYEVFSKLGEERLWILVEVEVLRDLGSLAEVVERKRTKEGFYLAKVEVQVQALDQELHLRPVECGCEKRSVSPSSRRDHSDVAMTNLGSRSGRGGGVRSHRTRS